MAITEIASLDEIRSYLRIPAGNDIDDMVITDILMPAAQDAIEREVGRVVAKPVRRELHDGGKPEIWLRELPVLYVQQVEEGWGYMNWDLDDQQVNTQPALSIFSYSLDIPKEGLVTRRSAGNVLVPFVSGRNNIRIDYVAGRDHCPAATKLAFMELVGVWYRGSQLRMSNQPNLSGFGATTAGEASAMARFDAINVGVPAAIIEMLKDGRRRPIIG